MAEVISVSLVFFSLQFPSPVCFSFADHSYSGHFSYEVFSEVSEMLTVKVSVLS